jgi:tetratricopeptide (TPR) repeat protein
MHQPTNADLHNAFRLLDRVRLSRWEIHPTDDLRRLVLAWAALADGEVERGDALLASLTNDNSVHPADVAFVRAFRRELDGDFQGIVAELEPHLAATGTLQDFRLRLRTADALLKLREFQRVQEVLDPLLQPPGRVGTLEAHFIVMQGMMATTVPKEQLIEQVALIDGLLEKGFRLTEPANVVYYATWLEHHRIEPPIAPLLNAHGGMVENFTTDDRDLIMTLLVMGDRHKAPAAVRAAGRNYARRPFPLEAIDPERASYLFTSHEEHEAARQAILMGYPKARIHKQQNLWGALLLTSYYAGRWKEALDIFRDHREEILRGKFSDNARMIRAVCELQLKRFPEALRTMEELGMKFYDQASGAEAAAWILATLALKPPAEIKPVAARAYTVREKDTEWLNEYTTTILTHLIVHERAEALTEWLNFLPSVLRAETTPDTLQRIGDMAVEWAMPASAEEIVGRLEALGQPARAALLRAFVASERGDLPGMEQAFARAIELLGSANGELLLMRARCRRRQKDFDGARADLTAALAIEGFRHRSAVLAIREGMLYDEGASTEELEAIRREIALTIEQRARNADEAAILNYEREQLRIGESAAAYLALARDAADRDPDNIEVLRLARKAANAPDATPEQREAARAIRKRWEDANLILPPLGR